MAKREYLTLEQLSQIIGLQTTTIRAYLSRAEFDKYSERIMVKSRYKRVFFLCEDFINKFYNFLVIKKQSKKADLLKNYWSAYQEEKGEIKINTFTLGEKYNMVNNQYQSLLKRYNEVLLLNKKLEVIEQICKEPADSVAVLELQNRIKEVLSE